MSANQNTADDRAPEVNENQLDTDLQTQYLYAPIKFGL